MRGKLILIEGTDCSGKETQTKLLIERLKKDNIKCVRMGFPDYDSPTGKIIGGPYLGKEHICSGWFSEGASNVDPKVSSLYYGADFLYHLSDMNKLLDDGVNVILDRYFYSSFAHQGGKEKDKDKRLEMYKWLEKLEFELLGLPDPDIKVFLHMPYDVAEILRKNRLEKLDQNESDKNHLLMAEESYIEIASMYNFKTIECNISDRPKLIEDISDDLYNYVKANL
ncbi:MAG: hypothetical protein Q4E75_06000 [bacterium]|nr:hypothetical protein [bacterium]